MISICIPVHVVDSTQVGYLKTALESISCQKLIKYEVVLSDDSANVEVQKLVQEFKAKGMTITYHNPEKGIGLSSNLNNSVKHSRGRFLKILFQDDYLAHDKVLFFNLFRLITSRKKWLVTGTIHFDENDMKFKNAFFPRAGDQFLEGINALSSPSVVLLYKKNYLDFSEKLHYLVDCEWYVRMSHNFGRPAFRLEIDIVNRLHNFQSTHDVKVLLNREILAAKSMHTSSSFRKLDCLCNPNIVM